VGQVTLLYGFQAEPTAIGDNHLRRLQTLREQFPDLPLGFMDHADGASDEAGWLGALALPYGIRVIEKHVTLGRRLGLEDAVSALDAADLAAYVTRLRVAEAALGDGVTAVTEAEVRYRHRALKAVVAASDLEAGVRLTSAHVSLKRTALPDGAVPQHRDADVLGRTTARAVRAGAAILSEDLA
jgi:sialic acid synthase SpsE